MNTQSTTFLPDINMKIRSNSKMNKTDIAGLNADDAECINQLDMMEQTIENNNKMSIVPVNKSSLEAGERTT